jgi:hypothetical protein
LDGIFLGNLSFQPRRPKLALLVQEHARAKGQEAADDQGEEAAAVSVTVPQKIPNCTWYGIPFIRIPFIRKSMRTQAGFLQVGLEQGHEDERKGEEAATEARGEEAALLAVHICIRMLMP